MLMGLPYPRLCRSARHLRVFPLCSWAGGRAVPAGAPKTIFSNMSAQPSGNTSARQTESSAAESSEASADPGVAIESITAAELAKVRPSLYLQDLDVALLSN